MKRKVLIHPKPAGAPGPLVDFIATEITGALRDFLNSHGDLLPNATRGMLVGSIRKRVINRLCGAHGVARLTQALKEGQ